MLPVQILISEHRLIEQMVSILEKEIKKTTSTGKVDPSFIDAAVDFFRTFADKYHHGKEEGMLFKGLSSKTLSDIDHKMMLELVMEHASARKTVNNLEALKDNYIAGKTETLNSILDMIKALVKLYPKHIYKEDVQFFYPSMKYFTQEEQERMLHEFSEFDRNFITKKYKQIVAVLGS